MARDGWDATGDAQKRSELRGGGEEITSHRGLLVYWSLLRSREYPLRTYNPLSPPVFELVLDALLPRRFPFLTFKWTGCGVADDDTVSRMEWKKCI